MAYILVLLSVIGFAFQITLTKLYQARTVTQSTSGKLLLEKSFFFTMARSATMTGIFFIVLGFRLEVTAFSAGVAALMALIVLLFAVIGMMVLSRGSMSVYTLFLMLGGMMLPFFVGVFIWNEPLSWLRLLGLGLLTLSLFAPLFDAKGESKKGSMLFFFLCLCVFILNGMSTVLSNYHQITPGHVDAISFVVLSNGLTAVGSVIPWALVKIWSKKTEDVSKDPSKDAVCSNKKINTPAAKLANRRYVLGNLLVIFALACVSGVASVLMLNSASELDASVLFPMITGGTLFFCAVAGYIFFKEKPRRYSAAGIIIAILATFLFFIG